MRPCGCPDFTPMPSMSLKAITKRRFELQHKIAEPGMLQILRDLDVLLYAANGVILFDKEEPIGLDKSN